MSELKLVRKSKHGNTEVSIFEHKGGYVVETASRAMWKVFRSLHDRYGRQYETNLFYHEDDINQIREGEVFSDLASVDDYISRDFNTEEQIIEEKNRKKRQTEMELVKAKARVKELEAQLGAV